MLSNRPTLLAASYLTVNAQSFRDRVTRLGALAAATPFSLGGPLADRTLGARLAWMGLRDMGEDRLVELGRSYAEGQLIPNLRAVGLDLLERARRDGARIVLVSDSLDVIVQPVAKHLRADDVVCNRMEMRNGRATGRLVDPIVSSTLGGDALRKFAIEHGWDLTRSLAYSSTGDDALLLGAVGRPCAVTPDRNLRRFARDNDWPVVQD